MRSEQHFTLSVSDPSDTGQVTGPLGSNPGDHEGFPETAQQPKGTKMNSTDSTTPATTTSTYEAGTWQATLDRSATLFEKSGKDRKRASSLLWDGAQEATTEWIDGDSDTDVNAEALYASVLDILGTPRKGDASKIKSVALAVKNHGLVLSIYPNLSKAYAEATRLTKTVQVQAAEDTAADEAVAAIQDAAPKSSSTPEGAALIVLSKGVDEAARLLLDALGATNTAAHRALMRAISQEIAGRIQPAPKPAKKAAAPKPKTGAKAKAPKAGAAKPKPASGAAKPKPAAPVVKAKPVAAAPVEDVEPTVGDMFEEFDVTDDAPVEVAPATTKPKPVRRGPVTR
jgi:hypothetical protein